MKSYIACYIDIFVVTIVISGIASAFIAIGMYADRAIAQRDQKIEALQCLVDENRQLRMEIQWLKCDVQSEMLRPAAPIEVEGPTLIEGFAE